jgi:hypothetical protein
MYKNNNQNMYFYQYIIVFLIYIRNAIKYYIGLEITKKTKSTKIHNMIKYNSICDEESGIVDSDCLFVFNKNTNKLVRHYCVLSKQKQD